MIKFLVILLVVYGCGVKSTIFHLGQALLGDNESTSSSSSSSSVQVIPSKNYKVYWNVPTFMCHQYGIFFDEVSKNFGIIQNFNDTFRGNQIAILYDPGIFPALLKTPNGSLQIRNGGVPQEGDLQKHLDQFRISIEEQIEPNFSGIGIIDFESWRPIFRQNWGSLSHYRDYSYDIEAQRHPYLNENTIKRLASKRFEDSGRVFMEETIKVAKQLRPNAIWSYYGYPQCFNLTPKQPNTQCDSQLKRENDEIQWLWIQENLLLPSIYIPMEFDVRKKIGLINGRLNEASRIAKKFYSRPKILPYFWYKYRDNQDIFLSYNDLQYAFREMLTHKIDGHVIWGSSNDVNNRDKCLQLKWYLIETLGPLVKNMISIGNQRHADDYYNNNNNYNDNDNDTIVIYK